LGGFFKSRWQEKGFSILVASKDNFKEQQNNLMG